MRDRIKWMLVGLGFTFGLQVLISLIFTGIAYSAARSETGLPQQTITLLVFGVTLGAFLVGGLVIGWMSSELRIGDAAIVAVVTLVLSFLIYTALPEGNKGQFFTGALLGNLSSNPGESLMFVVLSIVAAAVGAYWGYHIRVPREGVLDRVALLVGLVGAVVGPFLLLAMGGRDATGQTQPNLPWYFLVVVLVLVLAIIGVGFVMFTRGSDHSDEISISPEHHKEQG
jgi:hypothetical protein